MTPPDPIALAALGLGVTFVCVLGVTVFWLLDRMRDQA